MKDKKDMEINAFEAYSVEKLMEEMANMPKESLGKRQPGEKCKYEQK